MLDRYQMRIAIRGRNDECIPVEGAVVRSPPSAPRARPCVEDDRRIGKAADNCDIGEVRDPELVWTIKNDILRTIREDGLIMIAVGSGVHGGATEDRARASNA